MNASLAVFVAILGVTLAHDLHKFCGHFHGKYPLISVKKRFKVEPYSVHGSFLKLDYLKTEFNEDNGTYAIVKVTSHSCRIMVNLSISDYFEVIRHL